MTEPTSQHRVLASGQWGEVRCVQRPDGHRPAGAFIDNLKPRPRAQIQAVLNRLAEDGFVRGEERWRKIEDSDKPAIFEAKAHDGPGYRLYCVMSARVIYATHGGKKVGDRRLKNEVKRARRIFNEGVGQDE